MVAFPLTLPVRLPVTLPVTLPVRDPTNVVAVNVPDKGPYDKDVAVLSIYSGLDAPVASLIVR